MCPYDLDISAIRLNFEDILPKKLSQVYLVLDQHLCNQLQLKILHECFFLGLFSILIWSNCTCQWFSTHLRLKHHLITIINVEDEIIRAPVLILISIVHRARSDIIIVVNKLVKVWAASTMLEMFFILSSHSRREVSSTYCSLRLLRDLKCFLLNQSFRNKSG
jgi:hypothetical protein